MTFKPEMIELSEAEALVRERLEIKDAARAPVRQAIREGALRVFSGGCQLENDGDELAEQIRRGNPMGFTVYLADVDSLWPAADSSAPTAASTPTVNKGGRTALYDWDAAWAELVRLEFDRGTSGMSNADLTRHLQDWFVREKGREPAETEIKKRVRMFKRATGAET